MVVGRTGSEHIPSLSHPPQRPLAELGGKAPPLSHCALIRVLPTPLRGWRSPPPGPLLSLLHCLEQSCPDIPSDLSLARFRSQLQCHSASQQAPPASLLEPDKPSPHPHRLPPCCPLYAHHHATRFVLHSHRDFHAASPHPPPCARTWAPQGRGSC